MGSSTPVQIAWCLGLLAIFYTLGTVIFCWIERPAELQAYRENRALYEQMKSLYSFKHCEDPAFKGLSFCKDQAAFSRALRDYFNTHGNQIDDQYQWTPVGTLFFLTHLATTIGYGNSHPMTAHGRLATIMFAMIGIPIMGFAMTQVVRVILMVVSFLSGRILFMPLTTTRRQIIALWVLLCLFLFGGAFIYTQLETWTYLESLYFCFVTLSTVGFGDYLPSSPASKGFSIFYMVAGLGVCASIIAVMTGWVADSHSTVDAFFSEKCAGLCPDCCLGRSDSHGDANTGQY